MPKKKEDTMGTEMTEEVIGDTQEEGRENGHDKSSGKRAMWYRVRAYIIGTSPLLMNPVPDQVLEDQRTGTKTAKNRDKSRENEAGEKIYKRDGVIGIPVDNLYSALVEAGRSVPYEKKSNVSTADSSKLAAILRIEEEWLAIPPQWATKWFPNVKRGTNPNGGEMVAICRPLFAKWGFTATLQLKRAPVSEQNFQRLFEVAGSAIGLCDFRPNCRGRYGQFTVAKWEFLEDIIEETADYGVEIEILDAFRQEQENVMQ